jgi:4-amino-4-deoxy-L-arabinose transferase-like glycosyltransferase
MDLLFFPIMVLAILAPAALLRRRYDLPEALALGALVSLGGWSALALARFLLLLPVSTPRTVGLIALTSSVGAGIAAARVLVGGRQSDSPRLTNERQILAVAGGAALLVVGLEAVVPHFGIANLYYDWWEHFDLARFYHAPVDLARHYQDGYSVTSRTPVFNLLTSLGLTAFGDRFSVFQVGTAALAWLWVLPAMLLARRFLENQGLRLVAVLALSPLMLFAGTYPWPKGLVAFFALLSLDRFLALRQRGSLSAGSEGMQFGLASGLTLMTHEGFAGYLVPLFALLVWDRLRARAAWKPLLTACLFSALVALPWYGWAVAEYGLRGGLIGYPEPGYGGPMLWLMDHIVIIVSSVVPITVLFHAYADNALQQLFVAYLRTAVGLLGVAFFLRVLARAVQRTASAKRGAGPLLGFALAGIGSTTLLLNGWGNGWASAESVFIPAMVALLIGAVARAPLTEGMLALSAVECLAILIAAIGYLWSPVSATEPNAQLAAIEQVRFLGQDAWPVGLALLLTGAASSLYAAYAFRLPGRKKEPHAGWREAPSVV